MNLFQPANVPHATEGNFVSSCALRVFVLKTCPTPPTGPGCSHQDHLPTLLRSFGTAGQGKHQGCQVSGPKRSDFAENLLRVWRVRPLRFLSIFHKMKNLRVLDPAPSQPVRYCSLSPPHGGQSIAVQRRGGDAYRAWSSSPVLVEPVRLTQDAVPGGSRGGS